jgi:hypothetical protein
MGLCLVNMLSDQFTETSPLSRKAPGQDDNSSERAGFPIDRGVRPIHVALRLHGEKRNEQAEDDAEWRQQPR